MPKLPHNSRTVFIAVSTILLLVILLVIFIQNYIEDNLLKPTPKNNTIATTESLSKPNPPVIRLSTYCDNSNVIYIKVIRPFSEDNKYRGTIEYDTSGKFISPIRITMKAGENSTSFKSAVDSENVTYLRANSDVKNKQTDWSLVSTIRINKCQIF